MHNNTSRMLIQHTEHRPAFEHAPAIGIDAHVDCIDVAERLEVIGKSPRADAVLEEASANDAVEIDFGAAGGARHDTIAGRRLIWPQGNHLAHAAIARSKMRRTSHAGFV